jgi:hypothetical protein
MATFYRFRSTGSASGRPGSRGDGDSFLARRAIDERVLNPFWGHGMIHPWGTLLECKLGDVPSSIPGGAHFGRGFLVFCGG